MRRRIHSSREGGAALRGAAGVRRSRSNARPPPLLAAPAPAPRCAVIVNDMAELNIDAALLKSASLVQAEERLVEMSNGCICCTLRGDLLHEVRALVAEGRFDYLVIESTGIGEPMQARGRAGGGGGKQSGRRLRAACACAGGARRLTRAVHRVGQVAETFTMPLEEGGEPLNDVARLDTCVTVVDAANLMDNL